MVMDILNMKKTFEAIFIFCSIGMPVKIMNDFFRQYRKRHYRKQYNTEGYS